jgi:Autophagocytosis associated protein, active-site domain
LILISIILFLMAHDFCEDEFNKKALELFNMSEILSDNWKITEKNEKFYLSKKQTVSVKSKKNTMIQSENEDPSVAPQETETLVSIEYHVLFHPSYQVPVLYFNVHSGEKNVEAKS